MAINLRPTDRFINRHIGPSEKDLAHMLATVKAKSLDELIDTTVPASIRVKKPLNMLPAKTEREMLDALTEIAGKNQVFRSFIGLGYHDCITPAVIQRNILENPGWYTAYTPYQAEIAQGRLEALLNFQTMIMDLTGMEIANASLLDEGTAAAEAMHMAHASKHKAGDAGAGAFFVSEGVLPQTLDVVRTRAKPLGIEIVVGDHRTFDFKKKVFGCLVQYPAADGTVFDYTEFCARAHQEDAMVIVAADLLALTLLKAPGEFGADVAIGNTQRFGVPMGYGGPHAAYFATRNTFARTMPGRLIGVSEDSHGRPALRMALQTREQHIRREKATSNICTAQVLLAVMAGMYAVYHGPRGLKDIAQRVHGLAAVLSRGLGKLGAKVKNDTFFDTLRVEVAAEKLKDVLKHAADRKMNFRRIDATTVGITMDEVCSGLDLEAIWACFNGGKAAGFTSEDLARETDSMLPLGLLRTSGYLTHPAFNSHHSETQMQRYMRHLESKDLSLTHSMIPLGSCTMKLNAAAEMLPITWGNFCKLHPFAPTEQAAGYAVIFKQLEAMLMECTGFAGVSLQPNAGSQGEYAGLLVIRAYQEARGQGHRGVCLIPQSAHGTNPASAVMAGYKVVVVKCDENGNVDVPDLKEKAAQYKDELAALMVTYPSTHGVFEEEIVDICKIVHDAGGQVYMDGANMNAQVGLCRPGDIGADVCHINLHKTFSIPHGGGGPGMGPICVASHLAKFLPKHAVVETGGASGIGAVSAAPWGSADVLLISWSYITMMGGDGLTQATKMAILNANYIAARLGEAYPVLYRGKHGHVAHECILDMRSLKHRCNVEVEDIAKRLMDYGFHAPTVSFPVPSTMMVEPTESEPLEELNRFCEAMLSIHAEIAEIESGKQPQDNNVLKHAPHTAETVLSSEWNRPYSREKAAYPLAWVKAHKFWPSVGRLNNPLGDRKLICSCPPIESYQ
jgi:glycine dehydrogenase